MAWWETRGPRTGQSEEDYLAEGRYDKRALAANFVYRAGIIRDAVSGERSGLSHRYDASDANHPSVRNPEGWVQSNRDDATSRMERDRYQRLVWQREQQVPVAEHINGSEYWREALD